MYMLHFHFFVIKCFIEKLMNILLGQIIYLIGNSILLHNKYSCVWWWSLSFNHNILLKPGVDSAELSGAWWRAPLFWLDNGHNRYLCYVHVHNGPDHLIMDYSQDKRNSQWKAWQATAWPSVRSVSNFVALSPNLEVWNVHVIDMYRVAVGKSVGCRIFYGESLVLFALMK